MVVHEKYLSQCTRNIYGSAREIFVEVPGNICMVVRKECFTVVHEKYLIMMHEKCLQMMHDNYLIMIQYGAQEIIHSHITALFYVSLNVASSRRSRKIQGRLTN